MKVLYNCSCISECNSYYKNQAGNGLPYFSGQRYQKGYGFFSNIFRLAVPFIKKGLIHLGKKALNTSENILDDIAEGQNFRASLKKRSLETGSDIKNSILDVISRKQIGLGKRKLQTSLKKNSEKKKTYKRKKNIKKNKNNIKKNPKTITKKKKIVNKKKKTRKNSNIDTSVLKFKKGSYPRKSGDAFWD